MEAHSGTIELVPAAVGTTFRIRLPVEALGTVAGEAADEPAATAEPGPPPPRPRPGPPPCPGVGSPVAGRRDDEAAGPGRLLVEDDPNIVDLIRSNLSVRGFDSVVCTDGRQRPAPPRNGRA